VNLTRRKFLRTGTITAVAAGFGVAATRHALSQSNGRGHGPDVRRSSDVPLEAQKEAVFSFSPDTFRPYVGDYFQAPNARGEMIAMKLVRLDSYSPSQSAKKLTGRIADSNSFSLIFKADARLPLFVPIHRMSHPALGQFDLFLTERKDSNHQFWYEAVINHIP